MFDATSGPAYLLLLLAGICVSVFIWRRLGKSDPRLLPIYVGGLVGAFAGAKLVYFLAEGWMFLHHPQRWLILATGKTVLGALLGGYAGVEFAKKILHYTQPTGDRFAIVVPIGIIFGRIGCLLQGCCPGAPVGPDFPAALTCVDPQGVVRWPAVPAEIAFNLIALGGTLLLGHRRLLSGQHFHIYLIAYGTFRFLHEFVRGTPRISSSPISGYHIAALAVVFLGAWGFAKRRNMLRNRTP